MLSFEDISLGPRDNLRRSWAFQTTSKQVHFNRWDTLSQSDGIAKGLSGNFQPQRV
jgi:hypothetical protein